MLSISVALRRLRPAWILPLAFLAGACGITAVAAAPKQSWQPVGLCGGGGLFNPVASPHDPKLMMAECDMGARYISRDGGKTWKMIHREQIGSAVRGAPPLFHPTRPGVIYALSGFQAATLYVTRDNGETWRPLPDDRQPGAGLISRMFIDRAHPERLFVGTADGQVVFTDDEGGTWRRAEGVRGRVLRFAVDRAGPPGRRVVFVGTPAGVFRSDDGGKTFAQKTQADPTARSPSCTPPRAAGWKAARWPAACTSPPTRARAGSAA